MRKVETRSGGFCLWHGPGLAVFGPDAAIEPSVEVGGFYVREARHLSRLVLLLNGEQPWVCAAGTPDPDELVVNLTYPELAGGGGGGSGAAGEEEPRDAHGIPRRAMDLMLRYRLALDRLEVALVLTNRHSEPLTLDLAWEVAADFADLQEAFAGRREQQAPVDAEPVAAGSGEAWLRLRYRHEHLPLATTLALEAPGEWSVAPDRLCTRLALVPQVPFTCRLRIEAHDADARLDAAARDARATRCAAWRQRLSRVKAPGGHFFARLVNDAMDDLGSLALLEGAPDEWLAPAAGMPLYPALFGRDALTAGWQAAMLDRGAQLDATLARLGRLQGTRVDPARDEQPGRIIHSARRGPLARLDLNPFGRYYADFASPFMFVVGLAQLWSWTGERRLLERHWDTAARVLDWAREHGDLDGDGWLEYQTHAPQGPKNQGWKDSGDAIVDEHGRQVPAPMGTCELQGYWFTAQQLFAVLCAARGRLGDAHAYWRAAEELKARFNREWWLPEARYFALALDADKRLVHTVTSNLGHCIASGIVSAEHLPPLIERLFAPDMFSGWGLRTLSADHPAYHPTSYHRGSVWLVENATTAFGLRRFGFDTQALALVEALVDLARLHEGGRVPECVGGYARADWPHPGAYPRANPVQAWNRSALVQLLQTLLGLEPVAALDLLVVDPMLPAWLPELTLEGLRVGGATVTLRCWRDAHGRSHAEVVRRRGTLHLVRQPPPESMTASASDRLRALVRGLRP